MAPLQLCKPDTNNARRPQHGRFPHKTWLRYVWGAWCKYQSVCRRRKRIFHELHGFLHSHKFCEDLVEVLLCIWPLVDTVKCQVSVHRSCSRALKLFWNMPGTSTTHSMAAQPLLQQACVFSQGKIQRIVAVSHNMHPPTPISWLANLLLLQLNATGKQANAVHFFCSAFYHTDWFDCRPHHIWLTVQTSQKIFSGQSKTVSEKRVVS